MPSSSRSTMRRNHRQKSGAIETEREGPATMRTNSAAILRSALSDSIAKGTLDAFLAGLTAEELTRLPYDFELWARDDQLPPGAAQGGGAWTIWLMLGGGGAGKTRPGAGWGRGIAPPRAAQA